MRNDRTNRLAMLLVVFCCLGTAAIAMPATNQTVLSIVVGGSSTHIVGELEPLDYQFRNRGAGVFRVLQTSQVLLGINLELQNLPPPLNR